MDIARSASGRASRAVTVLGWPEIHEDIREGHG